MFNLKVMIKVLNLYFRNNVIFETFKILNPYMRDLCSIQALNLKAVTLQQLDKKYANTSQLSQTLHRSIA